MEWTVWDFLSAGESVSIIITGWLISVLILITLFGERKW